MTSPIVDHSVRDPRINQQAIGNYDPGLPETGSGSDTGFFDTGFDTEWTTGRIDSQKRLPKIGWKLGGLDSLRHNKKYFIGGHFSPPGKEV